MMPAQALRFRCLLVACFFLAFLTPVALRVRVDYWDGFVYLNNARSLAGCESSFTLNRPQLLPLCLLPAQWIGKATADWELALVLSHLASLVISSLYIYSALLFISPRSSFLFLGSAILLSLNLLSVHYSVFALADILNALCLTVGWIHWRNWIQSPSRTSWRLFVLWNTLSVLAKHQTILLFPLYPVSLWAVRRARLVDSSVKVGRQEWLTAAVAALCYAGVVLLVSKAALNDMGWMASAREAFRALGGHSRLHHFDLSMSSLSYLVEYVVMFGLPVVLLGLLGLWIGLRSSDLHGRLSAICFLGAFFLFSISSIGPASKEIRYTFFVLPGLIFLTLTGVEWIWFHMRRGLPQMEGWPRAALLGAILWFPTLQGIREWRRLMTEPAFASIPSREDYIQHGGAFSIPHARADLFFLDGSFDNFRVGEHTFAYLGFDIDALRADREKEHR